MLLNKNAKYSLAALGCSVLFGSTFMAGSAFADGRKVFMENCSACHQANAKGVPGAFPALANNKLVKGNPTVLVKTVLNGRAGMPAFKGDLSDNDIAMVLTYLRSNYGNKAPAINSSFVKAVHGGSTPKKQSLQAH